MYNVDKCGCVKTKALVAVGLADVATTLLALSNAASRDSVQRACLPCM